MAAAAKSNSDNLTLDKVREALIRQEDTIVFRLIQRANFPVNSPTYDEKFASFSGSLLQFVVKETEALQSKVNYCFITNGQSIIFLSSLPRFLHFHVECLPVSCFVIWKNPRDGIDWLCD